jgi:hypothetical protein
VFLSRWFNCGEFAAIRIRRGASVRRGGDVLEGSAEGVGVAEIFFGYGLSDHNGMVVAERLVAVAFKEAEIKHREEAWVDIS